MEPGDLLFPELWWQYRIRKGSMAQSFNREKVLYLYHLINKKHSSFVKEYSSEVINLLNYNGAGIHFNNPSIEDEAINKIGQKIIC